ncbi:dipicolinate synthase subunit A [Oceanobacillus picturae]|jgi:dipicolinate synthase subunit A|uniref:Dipicolinate synthase subunit A n=1 Tax=Oceanobacillus picturae TaxID=171693 RepID=W9A9N4_9BACI|nr:dipicolinic acid synthetase subunit A [Oceanobacillus picturae]GAQ16147.1 dipicolinate synthase subunit A [Oceanobacillus picturae]CDO02183.1 Dipicolinate synthase subunit A [Oceanobacillus picturae]
MSHTIAVIGGDARYLELIRQLQAIPGANINLVGFDKLEQGFTGLKQLEFSELKPEELDVLILPITGTDNTGNVETVFSHETIHIAPEWFGQLKDTAIIFTGISSDYLKKVTTEEDISLIPLLNRDDVAIYNSIPTAEGSIMMAIEHTDYTIHGSRVMVAGFGRVGKTIANKFAALGAKVSVATKSSAELARISEMALTAIHLDKMADYANEYDVVINTIPAAVIDRKTIQHLPTHAIIIDLASKPGGTDFDYAKQRGIKAILARSLPGIVAPKTSGRILADVIKQFLQENTQL